MLVSDVNVCMLKHTRVGGSVGACSPLEIRCPEIDRSRAVHGSRSIAPNFWLSTYALILLSELTSNFQERRY